MSYKRNRYESSCVILILFVLIAFIYALVRYIVWLVMGKIGENTHSGSSRVK